MSEIAILAKAVKEPYQKIRYAKLHGDNRISYKKDGSIDILKSVISFAITPDKRDYKKCKICGVVKHKTDFFRRELTCNECASKKRKEAHRKKRLKEVEIYWPDHEPGVCVYCGANHNEKKFSFRNGQFRKVCNECRWKRDKQNRSKDHLKKRRIKERTDNKTRLNKLMRNGIGKDLKSRRSSKSKKSWSDLVGYSASDLEKHLKKSLKKLPGYTWKDFLDSKLHIDHIIPINAFDYDSAEHPDFKRCWALENLQLLPAFENISKSDKCDSFQIAF